MRIRPTELGWKGLLLLLALEGAFLATAYSNLFFLLIAFCVALGALAAFWTWRNLRGLTVRRLVVPSAAAGLARPVQIDLAAPRPCADVRVELLLEGGAVPVGALAMVGATTTLAGTLPGRARGLVAITGVRLSSRFPLGLFVARCDVPCDAEVVTYPAPTSASARPDARAAMAGDGHQRFTRSATAAELRPFRTGDSLGDVHWKATARRGQPVVKERDREGDAACVLVVDRRCAAAALDLALSAAAAAVLQSRTGSASLRLLSQEAAFTLGQDPAAVEPALRWLAGAAPLPADAPPPPRAAGAVRLPATAGHEVLA